MKEKFLIINAGSSSLKFSLYELPEENEIVNGYIEKIGKQDGFLTLKYSGKKDEEEVTVKDHTEAVKLMMNRLENYSFIKDIEEIKGIGHRVLHGGELYSDSIIIDEEVLNNIKSLTKLGPLHHPGEVAGIESIQKIFPSIPQVAVFDTAFHQTIPEENYMYATPYLWYKENGVRKYGFHGTSHKYITEKMKEKYGKTDINLIICHLGSGASMSCIKNGICIDTTMGLTPLDGLIMGTRSGAIDPSIIEYICKEKNLSIEQATYILNNESGLIGIAGQNDFRDLQEKSMNGDKNSTLAISMFENSVIKYIAQYYFELEGNVDAMIFTAGIGENAINLRKDIIKKISKTVNVDVDEYINGKISRYTDTKSGKISTDNSSFDILVEPTNEELMILRDTRKTINKSNKNTKKLNYTLS
ncbi:MAG: acetate kinase [Bacilli bacterium]|nr:acetate kinase [Bacilli bacterium]